MKRVLCLMVMVGLFLTFQSVAMAQPVTYVGESKDVAMNYAADTDQWNAMISEMTGLAEFSDAADTRTLETITYHHDTGRIRFTMTIDVQGIHHGIKEGLRLFQDSNFSIVSIQQ